MRLLELQERPVPRDIIPLADAYRERRRKKYRFEYQGADEEFVLICEIISSENYFVEGKIQPDLLKLRLQVVSSLTASTTRPHLNVYGARFSCTGRINGDIITCNDKE